MSEAGDHYIGAKILLPRGDKMVKGLVVVWSHDANGNVMGRVYLNPILNTRAYQVEFGRGEITELTTSAIAE